MQDYVATVSRTIHITAPSASAARAIAELGFAGKLKKEDLKEGMSVSNIQDLGLKVEKQ